MGVSLMRESACLIETVKSPAADVNLASETRLFIVVVQPGQRPRGFPSLGPSGQNATSLNAGGFGALHRKQNRRAGPQGCLRDRLRFRRKAMMSMARNIAGETPTM